MIVLSSSDVEPDNTSRRKKKRTSAEPEHKSGSASSKDMKSEIIDIKKTEKVKVKSEEPVKKRTTRSSSKKIKTEESDIEELPPVVKSHEEVVVDDDEVVTCSITGISLKELTDVRREVMQEMVQLPEHLRTRYYFEQSLEVKIQIYFGINDPEKLKRVSKSDPFKVGDELIVANYARKPVTKCDMYLSQEQKHILQIVTVVMVKKLHQSLNPAVMVIEVNPMHQLYSHSLLAEVGVMYLPYLPYEMNPAVMVIEVNLMHQLYSHSLLVEVGMTYLSYLPYEMNLHQMLVEVNPLHQLYSHSLLVEVGVT